MRPHKPVVSSAISAWVKFFFKSWRSWKSSIDISTDNIFKGCVHYIFAGLVGMSNREHLWNKKKYFLFHFKSSFCSWDNKILNFQIFKCHDIIKCHENQNMFQGSTNLIFACTDFHTCKMVLCTRSCTQNYMCIKLW